MLESNMLTMSGVQERNQDLLTSQAAYGTRILIHGNEARIIDVRLNPVSKIRATLVILLFVTMFSNYNCFCLSNL